MQNELDKKILCGSIFLDTVSQIVAEKECRAISFVNPFSYLEVLKYDSLVRGVDYFFSDGALLSMLHSMFYTKVERVSFDFSSIANDFLLFLSDKGLSLAIVGATEQEVQVAVSNLKELYPRLNVVYFRDGYIDDQKYFVSSLNKIGPDVVLLGMGAPNQEKMALVLKESLEATSLVITCGGFLTQTSIKKDYYHPIVKRLGVRWLQRVIMHGHVRRRVVKDYPVFLLNYLFAKIRG
ncbi:WecB/TagA/CpsF family glycosyltransferase [Vibrio alfacsensis]|uniref:WecB/TagA/CpsF family glycosyltransferase n=1 Tax=Vibrio TaxID=662 RepID=UPI0040681CC5